MNYLTLGFSVVSFIAAAVIALTAPAHAQGARAPFDCGAQVHE